MKPIPGAVAKHKDMSLDDVLFHSNSYEALEANQPDTTLLTDSGPNHSSPTSAGEVAMDSSHSSPTSAGEVAVDSASHLPSPIATEVIPFVLQPTNLQQTRRSTRVRKPPAWLEDFVTKASSSQPPAIDQVDTSLGMNVSTVQLSPSSKALLESIKNTSDPVTYFEAVTDPKWCQAMDAELRALEENGAWKITSYHQVKRLLAANGYIEPNSSLMAV